MNKNQKINIIEPAMKALPAPAPGASQSSNNVPINLGKESYTTVEKRELANIGKKYEKAPVMANEPLQLPAPAPGTPDRFSQNNVAINVKPTDQKDISRGFSDLTKNILKKESSPTSDNLLDKKSIKKAGIIASGGAAGAGTASASSGNSGDALKVKKAVDNAYKTAEKDFPMINKDYVKTLVSQESSDGIDDKNRKLDQGKYGWVVGFTKPTYQDIVNKAKTSTKWSTLLNKMPGFDTPDDAIKSAMVYSEFLLRNHTKEQETGNREWKDITATQLYKLYNGGGSPEGVRSFDKKFNSPRKLQDLQNN